MMQATSKTLLIPTCQRCRARKVRCADRGGPRCSNCTKADAECIVVDAVTLREIRREDIKHLEDRLGELESRRRSLLRDKSRTTNSVQDDGRSHSQAHSTFPSHVLKEERGGFLGDNDGLNFLQYIFFDASWQTHNSPVFEQLATRPLLPELNIREHAQPHLREASELTDIYLQRFHKTHPVLLKQQVLDILRRAYNPTPLSSEACSAQDFFRLFMVFAIGSITPYRRGSSKEHPYGYFLAARRYFGAIKLTGSIDAIQNLLLLARFGMYYHIGTSIWEISQVCMRQCIEYGLQATRRNKTVPLTEQHWRCIFWASYILDRYSSRVLGRPFAISDDDITVELPFDTNEEDIPTTASDASLLDVRVDSQSHPTDLSVFIHYTKLRLLSSRINKTFDPTLNTPHVDQQVSGIQLDAPGKVYRDFALYSTRLKEWRDSAPTFTSPRSVFEQPEWYDMLLEQERLFLARGAIRKAPKQGGRPPTDILTFYRGCAERVVEQYTILLDRSLITWTRGSFYLIFTAGLSILYCVSLGGRQDKEVAKTLDACSDILQKLKTEMPDAGKFVVVFEELRKKLVNFSMPANHPPSEGDDADEERIRAQEHPVALFQSDGVPAEANATTAETQIQRDPGVWGMMAIDADADENGDGSFSSLHNAPPVGASNLMLQHDVAIQPRLTLADWEMDDDLLMRSLEPSYGEFSWGDIDIDQIPFI